MFWQIFIETVIAIVLIMILAFGSQYLLTRPSRSSDGGPQRESERTI